MATAVQNQQSVIQQQPLTLVKPVKVAPLKIAMFGEQGVGKTVTAALLATALSKKFHAGAPVYVTDPELGWQFPKSSVFEPEGIQVVQKTVPTFAAMRQDLRDAEKAGACVYVVEIVKIWKELLATVRRDCGQNWGNQLSALWTAWVAQFLNSPLHCIALGRVGDVTEELLDEKGEVSRVKIGEKLNAGGSSNFGYEPHLVIRLNLEQKPRRKGNIEIEGEGRMVHRAMVVKDRTMSLNGRIFRWADKQGYKVGGYGPVWDSLQPHFLALQKAYGNTTLRLDTEASSSHLIDEQGNSEWYAMKQRKEVLSGELHASMDYLFGGQDKEARRLRLLVFDHIFGFKSKEAADAAPVDKIERGVRILQAFENRCKSDGKIIGSGELNILSHLDIDIAEFDQGKAEELDLPF